MVKAGRKFLGRNIMRSKVPGAHFVCQDAQLSPAFIGVHPALILSLYRKYKWRPRIRVRLGNASKRFFIEQCDITKR